MIVYAFNHCPCIYESADATISLHKTKEGAETAMELHKKEALKNHEKWLKSFNQRGENWDFDFGDDQSWSIKEMEILD